jgi:hypothetical protein
MKTTDLFKTSSKKLNEGLSKTFGKKIDFASFDLPKLEDVRNKLRTQIHQVRSESGFNENMENDAYHEAQWMLDAINAELAEREELLAQGGTAEVEEEADIENMDEVHDIFKRYERAAEEGEYGDAWGDPDMNKVMSFVSAGKLEAAAEEFVNAFADRDGGEVQYGDNMYEDLLNDLKAELDTTEEDITAERDNMGFSDKEIKMAYGVLNDPRLKGGNLTKAAEIIEKIAPGLSKHPGVQKAMRATSESIQTGEEMNNLVEGEVQQASAIVTAKTMVDRISRFIEELSSMENETLLQLGDSIRDEIGQEQAKSFIEGSAPSIQQSLEALKGTRDQLSQSVNTLATGEAPADMLGAEPGADMEAPAPEAGADMGAEEVPAEDEFAAAEPAAGGLEAAGREQRESIQRETNLMRILAG